ncbi:MAG: hypothetical protein CTY16_14505 [Methylobacter sp.]|nr:MAG: hypothetical protein CTY16_14505 [Methylobacter sp.]
MTLEPCHSARFWKTGFYHLKWPAFLLMLTNLFDCRCPKKSFCPQELMGSKFNYYQTKAAIGNFGEWSVGNDPEQPVAFLYSGQLAKSKFCEMESYKADISDLTKSAIKRQSVFYCNDRCSLQRPFNCFVIRNRGHILSHPQ